MRFHALCFASALVVPTLVCASNGFQLIGYSLEHLGVAGAVTANPLTATTSITNPAGLSYVPSEGGMSWKAAFLSLDAGFGSAPGANDRSEKRFELMPSIAAKFPTDNPKLSLGIAVGPTAGSGTDFEWPELGRASSSSVKVVKIAPAISYQVDDRVSVGFSPHINLGSVAMSNSGFGASTLPTAFAQGAETVGLGFGVGVMVEAVPNKLRLGASYQTETGFSTVKFPSSVGDYSGQFNLPQQIALGAAYEVDERTTLSLDWKWLDWSSTLKELYIYGPGLPEGGVNLGTGWNDQNVVAVGLRRKLSPGVVLLAGFNRGDEPFSQSLTSKNIMTPAFTKDHYTLGLTYQMKGQWSLGWVLIHSPKRTISDGVTTLSTQTTTVGLSAGFRL